MIFALYYRSRITKYKKNYFNEEYKNWSKKKKKIA